MLRHDFREGQRAVLAASDWFCASVFGNDVAFIKMATLSRNPHPITACSRPPDKRALNLLLRAQAECFSRTAAEAKRWAASVSV